MYVIGYSYQLVVNDICLINSYKYAKILTLKYTAKIIQASALMLHTQVALVFLCINK